MLVYTAGAAGAAAVLAGFNPFRTQAPFWGQASQNSK